MNTNRNFESSTKHTFTKSALVAVALLFSASTATANDAPAIEIGIYAPTKAAAAVWSCEAVLNTLSRMLTQRLDQDVDVVSHVESDLSVGQEQMLSGEVALGRFPNVPGYWVAHPTTRSSTAAAFVEVINVLGYEDLVADLTLHAGDNIDVDCDEIEARAADFGRGRSI